MTATALDDRYPTPPPPPRRLRPAPPWQPPYDDDPVPVTLRVVADELPFDARPWEPAGVEPGWDDLPDPAAWARAFLQAALESVAGRRAPRQLERVTSPAVFAGLRRAATKADRSGTSGRSHRGPGKPPAVIRSVRAMAPVGGVAEVSAVIVRGVAEQARVGAVAARLEAHHGHWRCVVLQIG